MNARILKAIKELPSALAHALEEITSHPSYDATLSSEQFSHLMEVSGLKDEDLRVALLPVAAAYSHTPISNFYVGAIARGLSGRLYFGANVEFLNVQLGQTIHAEQCAISHAWMKREHGIKDITVNFSPCGHCRQFMNELNTATELSVQLPHRQPKTLHEYLPEAFGPQDIGIESALMTEIDHGKSFESDKSLVNAALNALNMSHAPYSHNLSGVAVQTESGAEYSGAYAENAAFNPSLPPLQVALIQLLLAEDSLERITNAVLIESNSGTSSHFANTQATLQAINPDISLEYISL
ncbi:Cytidine deaminase [Vibrio nigripulchritudo SOn1]|uniref:Cytidine deaminase n=1 Tax=Vibrio nigripulchritudo SOn1 TaxID=1238450 RepID=A0AAV2VJ47_9VIBR|nr:cytidine deaminase [Vibrio nigripulchritudo]CCO44514.1 Cytidine deaminase [Vibrio nigripulchritudo SOn1]